MSRMGFPEGNNSICLLFLVLDLEVMNGIWKEKCLGCQHPRESEETAGQDRGIWLRDAAKRQGWCLAHSHVYNTDVPASKCAWQSKYLLQVMLDISRLRLGEGAPCRWTLNLGGNREFVLFSQLVFEVALSTPLIPASFVWVPAVKHRRRFCDIIVLLQKYSE